MDWHSRFQGPCQALLLSVPKIFCYCRGLGYARDTDLHTNDTGDYTSRIASQAAYTASIPMMKALVNSLKGLIRSLVGMALRRLALNIFSARTTFFGASSSRVAPKFPTGSRRNYPELLGDFLLTPTRLEVGFNFIPWFKTELSVVFFHAQCKDCTASSNGIKVP